MDDIRRSVCFVHLPAEDGVGGPIGTAFFLAWGNEGLPDGRFHVFTVTARHVIEAARSRGYSHVLLRVNLLGGGTSGIIYPLEDWHFHPDDSGPDDFAVLRGTPTPDLYDLKSLSPSVVRHSPDDSYQVDVGDEVIIPGLFVNHPGSARVLPIVRTGSIAALPEEPIRTALGEMDAFLIEARSIGGLSGSPVLARVDPNRVAADSGLVTAGAEGPQMQGYILLGLMHGHFQVTAPPTDPTTGMPNETVNMGIGIVPPVGKLIETLDHVGPHPPGLTDHVEYITPPPEP